MNKYNIGIFHYKVGGTDGVSLELGKWKSVLEKMGHNVYLCAGDLGTEEGTRIPEMFHHTDEATRLYRNTFIKLEDYSSEAAYRSHMIELADRLEDDIMAFINEHEIDFLIPENVWSVAINPAVGLALARIAQKLRVPVVAHHHDFYWERIDGVALTCETAMELADGYYPPRGARIRHVVINELAQKTLMKRKGIDSQVVPNVFDFESATWEINDFNKDLREKIGLNSNDLFILQATRVVPRKGIEMAIDFVKALDSPDRRKHLMERGLYNGQKFTEDSRIVLVLAGYDQDDPSGTYLARLKKKAEKEGVDMITIDDRVASTRGERDGKKIYSLWDTYVHADFVTYPSYWEGWGNQFLEAVHARLPMLVFEYPVYLSDIKPKGFEVVSLGEKFAGTDSLNLVYVDDVLIHQAADQAVRLLTESDYRKEIVNHNFDLAKIFYSMQALAAYLSSLLSYFIEPDEDVNLLTIK